MRRLLLRALLCLCVPSTAVADPDAWHPLAEAEPDGERTPAARIYNGEVTDAHPAVAKLLIGHRGGTGLCTGALIAPSAVLTAAHCVLQEGLVGINAVFSDGVDDVGYRVERYAVHPDYAPERWPLADVAVLALERPVAGVTPLPTAVATPPRGARGVIVGFGEDEASEVGRKRMGNVRLRRCPRRALRGARLEAGRLEQSICWRPRRHADTCYGDSGGPLLVEGILAGVTSGGYPGCQGRLSWDTDVALFAGWISDLLAEAPR